MYWEIVAPILVMAFLFWLAWYDSKDDIPHDDNLWRDKWRR